MLILGKVSVKECPTGLESETRRVRAPVEKKIFKKHVMW